MLIFADFYRCLWISVDLYALTRLALAMAGREQWVPEVHFRRPWESLNPPHPNEREDFHEPLGD